jgi:1-acyl-sn-glycerol-3-phosphate acyltransferase
MRTWIYQTIHPLLLAMMKVRGKQIYYLNQCSVIQGAAIYAVNHSARYDLPIAAEAIGTHAFVLAGKQRLELMDRIGMSLNGAIWVDRKDKKQRANVKNRIVQLLKKGNKIIMFPEGTWNLTPSKPMLPLYWGCIDIARETGSPIVPLILEYRGTECFVKFGEPICIEGGKKS